MIITIINGSYRKNGATAKILLEFYQQIETAVPEAQIHMVNLSDLHGNFCTGCLHCYRTGACAITSDGMEELHGLMDRSDGIIFGSPTYVGNVTGLFKSFIDRVHMVVEQLLYQKPCIVVTTYENAEGNRAISIMKHTILNAGGYVQTAIAVKNPLNQNPLTPQIKRKIEKAALRLTNTLHKKASVPLFNRIYQYIAVHFVMKPLAYRKQEDYQGVINNWYRKGILK